MGYLRGVIGIAIIIFIAWLLSANRKKVDWRLVVTGILLQLVIEVLVLKV
jgi:CNT family concentrative nucleoside transporter